MKIVALTIVTLYCMVYIVPMMHQATTDDCWGRGGDPWFRASVGGLIMCCAVVVSCLLALWASL